ATLEWREVGATDWTTATLTRASGVFTASLDVSGAPQDYDLRVVLTDPDGVQNGTSLETSATLEHTVEALRIYLPLMRR
ncbi:MAG: hypothetical protein HGA19_24120, partial [Oscillochloris sp.]|nr:hypothetical protein [Oscillochloris sp.]